MNPTTNTNAPRILQPISGNFTISTLVKFPQIQADGFQAAGLLLWQDQNNFLRVDRYISSIDFEQVANGVFTHEAPNSLASAIITSNQMELQIQRKNGFFTASWRIPGQSWNTINTIGLPLQNMMVGFDMINDASSDMSATFAYFQASCA
jgi:regulation of enolase protein 1 (concanavalin A-like superfamily)